MAFNHNKKKIICCIQICFSYCATPAHLNSPKFTNQIIAYEVQYQFAPVFRREYEKKKTVYIAIKNLIEIYHNLLSTYTISKASHLKRLFSKNKEEKKF